MEREMACGRDTVTAVAERSESDRVLGRRVRLRWNVLVYKADRAGLDEDQLRGFIDAGGLVASDEQRKAIALSLGFDWEAAAAFFAEIAPIIIEMFAAC